MVLRGTIHAAITGKYRPVFAIHESEGHDLVMINNGIQCWGNGN